jgi:CheY-like chemotaxis protein
MSDAHLLYRILMNLISNAIRYTSRGGVLVACRRSGNHTRLEVWDTGAGISPQHRDDIFKEFVQLDNPERDRSKGLGLGLSIVERAARVLNHRLAMRSVRGRGSCFSLEVPIADPVTSGALPAETHAQRFTFADCTVLVVEDDSLSRRALVDLLRSWNCIVVETRTAEEAQRALAEYCRPDVIASDFRLPKQQSGIDVVLQARTTLGYEVAAFIMSGDTDADVIATAKSVYLPLLHKPVQAARLRTMLRLLLKSSRTRKA